MSNTRTTTKATTKAAANRRKTTEEAPLADELEVARDVVDYLKEYAREKPEIAALWCFGIGFVLGWKLKMW